MVQSDCTTHSAISWGSHELFIEVVKVVCADLGSAIRQDNPKNIVDDPFRAREPSYRSWYGGRGR